MVKKPIFPIGASLMVLIIFLAIQPSQGLSASGIVWKEEIAPNDHITHEIDVSSNEDEAPFNLTVEVMDWLQNPSGANIAVEHNLNMSDYSAKDFLRASPESFHLEPGATQKVLIEGDVPSDPGSGGKYAIISVQSGTIQNDINTNQDATETKSMVGMQLAINTMVLLTISGSDLAKIGQIESCSLEEPILTKQQNISLRFKNIGNYHYKFLANGVLRDAKGTALFNTSSNLMGSILPSSYQDIQLSMVPPEELQPGTYMVDVSAKLEDGTVLDTKEIAFEIKS